MNVILLLYSLSYIYNTDITTEKNPLDIYKSRFYLSGNVISIKI